MIFNKTDEELMKEANDIQEEINELNERKTIIVAELNRRQEKKWSKLSKKVSEPGGYGESVLERINQ